MGETAHHLILCKIEDRELQSYSMRRVSHKAVLRHNPIYILGKGLFPLLKVIIRLLSCLPLVNSSIGTA